MLFSSVQMNLDENGTGKESVARKTRDNGTVVIGSPSLACDTNLEDSAIETLKLILRNTFITRASMPFYPISHHLDHSFLN